MQGAVMLKRCMVLVALSVPILASGELTLKEAIRILKKDNLEVKIAKFDQQMKDYEAKAVEALNYGKLDLTIMGMRSNDAGNVFGFKLQSREATFGDFGFAEFDMSGATNPLVVAPKDLNYPDARNHFISKLTYMLPLYTGGKLTEYRNIMYSMAQMSRFDTKKIRNQKIYEVKKAFYDISLIEHYIQNLHRIYKNINKLEDIIRNMKKEGYAKETDLLEVQARKAEVVSMYNQAKLNKDLAYQFLEFLLKRKVKKIKLMKDMAPMPKVTAKMLAARNIDIQKAKLGLKITGMALGLEDANFRPMVGAFGEYGSADDKLMNDFFDKDSYTVGMQMQWNIFNGGTDHANREKARVNVMKVHEQVRLAKRGIALKAKMLQTEIGGKDAQIRSYRTQLKFARTVYKKYQERYKEGISSISDVLIKQAKELEVLLKLLTVKNERNSKVFALQSLLNWGAKK